MSAEPLPSGAGGEDPVEALAREAARKMMRGARRAALEIYRRVLELDARHPDALREVARDTEGDEAVAHYRRAATVGGLGTLDYLRWAAILLAANPPRRRQALDVVSRLRKVISGSGEDLAFAARKMVEYGELHIAAEIAEDITDPAGLSEDGAFDLVVVMRSLFDSAGPWAGRYEDKKGKLDDLVRDRETPGLLLQAGSIRWVGEDYSGAKQSLERVVSRGDDPTAKLAARLLMILAVVEGR
ncbi:MAG: hypothetical protein QOF58_7336 [Pseudonocardiales bacterium]|nr:hypothetical protein [Pseudonocardiales bacterium]